MKKIVFFLFLLLSFIYLYFQSLSIYGGDGGELVTAAYIAGIPHAPGFPLYTLLGYLIIRLVPFFTVAWRVGLLSSLLAVISRVVFFLLLYKLTKSRFYSLIAVLIYSFIYPVWLFSEIAEIVSLNVFFFIIILYLSISYFQTGKIILFDWLLIALGMALFHNYIIALLLPGITYLLSKKRRLATTSKQNIKILFLVSFGILPYLYAFLASARFPVLDAEHPNSFAGLLKLITRSSYGTFRLSKDVYFSINTAYNNILNLLNFILIDFKIIGVLIMVIGMIYLFKTNKNIFKFLIINLLLSFLFFAYASFPLNLNYHLGTFEKYLPLPYLYLTILIAFGGIGLETMSNNILGNRRLRKISLIIISVSLIIFPLIIFRNNYQRILVLKNDFTAENLGRDILTSTPKNGILNLFDDTSYFNTLYVRYVLKERPDVKLIKFDKLKNPNYQQLIKIHYPEVYLPKVDLADELFLRNFLEENSKHFPILNSAPHALITHTWLPNGLLWRYYPENKPLPKAEELIKDNLITWTRFHMPLSGSLAQYQSLLLSDVLRVYALGHQSFGMILDKNQEYDLAINEFKAAINYWPKNLDNYINLTKLYINTKQCQKAENVLKNAQKIQAKNLKIYKYFIDLYSRCYQNLIKAEEFSRLYEKLRSTKRIKND